MVDPLRGSSSTTPPTAVSAHERLEVVGDLRDELGFDLELVDIGGRPELEARYRELLPMLEIDGERAFTYFVDADALRHRLVM